MEKLMSVKNGDKIAVHYTGWLEDGTKFDSSVDSGETFKFQVGEGMVIKGFDDAVIGMEIGNKKKITISPENGYGERNEKYVITVEKKSFPADAAIETGSIFEMHSDHGDVIPVRVVEIKDENVVLDANHPLAGEALTFEIELIETGVDIPDYEHHHHGCCCGNEDCDDDCDEECDEDDENCGCGCGCDSKK
ncbi:peptidylprolyl isomerase [bacterium]|jgi:peptidylprolyl isomerase|nr:peptidylprolyl isomerase [bacterium]